MAYWNYLKGLVRSYPACGDVNITLSFSGPTTLTAPVLLDLRTVFTYMTPDGFYQYFDDLTVHARISPFTTICFDDDECYHLETYRHNYHLESAWAN